MRGKPEPMVVGVDLSIVDSEFDRNLWVAIYRKDDDGQYEILRTFYYPMPKPDPSDVN